MKLAKVLLASCLLVASSISNAATLKIATLSPDGSAWMQKFRAGAKEIKSRTDGRVKIKFYPGGVMGDDESVLKKIRIRQLHGGAVTAGSLARFYPDSQVYSIPMGFDSLEQVDVARAAFDPIISEGFEKGGFITFGFAGGGFAYIMSKDAIRHPKDLIGKKAWAPGDDAATVAAFDTFSISPIPLPIGDVLAGLQTGLIDTIATSPVGAVTLQWHTQVKYVTKVPLVYIYAALAVQDKAFNKLKDPDQLIVKEVFERIFAELEVENKADNDKALAALASQGIEILEPSASDLAEWKRLAEIASGRMVQAGAVSAESVAKLKALLK
ncbi:MAG: C4-dicarboxylate ABC transporter [Alteromonadaceae bacterium]|nr:C4-dicarboxylate ABC transporter [Alteromonadaceae bacterium]